jgi:hypothetical protein
MPDPTFQGRVILHPDYGSIQTKYPEVKTYTTAFKQYWEDGFHPLIGKDGVLPVPEIYSGSAIGRAHVEPLVKDPRSHSSTEECWMAWRTPQLDSHILITPTSNTFLMYCVNYKRDACLIGYLDGADRLAHDVINQDWFRRLMQHRAESFYNRTPRVGPMPVEEHDQLFSDKWLR